MHIYIYIHTYTYTYTYTYIYIYMLLCVEFGSHFLRVMVVVTVPLLEKHSLPKSEVTQIRFPPCLVHFEEPKTASNHFWARTVRGVKKRSAYVAQHSGTVFDTTRGPLLIPWFGRNFRHVNLSSNPLEIPIFVVFPGFYRGFVAVASKNAHSEFEITEKPFS